MDVLSARIPRRSLKLLLEFAVPGRVEFKHKPVAVFQRSLVRCGQWIILLTKRVNRADEIKWRRGIGHAPDTALRKLFGTRTGIGNQWGQSQYNNQRNETAVGASSREKDFPVFNAKNH